jgi:hypothetical protein
MNRIIVPVALALERLPFHGDAGHKKEEANII